MSKLLQRKNPYAYFNGTSSYIQYADNNVFSFTDGVNDIPFEVEFDAYITNSLTSIGFVTKRSTSAAEFQIFISNGLLYCRIYDTTILNFIGAYYNASLLLNTQYKIKITYDGSKLWTGINFYINNEKKR
jgi:hypothetical protein